MAVFSRLRSESRRGRKPASGKLSAAAGGGAESGKLAQRLSELERAQKALTRQVEGGKSRPLPRLGFDHLRN